MFFNIQFDVSCIGAFLFVGLLYSPTSSKCFVGPSNCAIFFFKKVLEKVCESGLVSLIHNSYSTSLSIVDISDS
jgi:hypothetical protein